MKEQVEIKVGNTITCKIISTLICMLWIIFISWGFGEEENINYKMIILYMIGILVSVWVLLKILLTFIYVRGNEIKWQSAIPFIYKKTNFSNIKKVKLMTRMTNEDMPYDVMIFYGEKRKLFTVSMRGEDSKKLYQAAASYYGIRIQDLRKKGKR